MVSYTYQVRDGSGQLSTGTIRARNADAAHDALSDQGKDVVGLSPAPTLAVGQKKPKKVRQDDIIFFANQLAVMVDAGVPLSESLDSIGQSTEHAGLQALIADLSEQVKGGFEFSTALQRHAKVFGELFISLVRASEVSGTMGPMLQRAGVYMAEARDTRKQVKGALIYPVSMLVFCVLVVVGLLVFILPRFESIYSGKGKLLPAPTRILMSASRGIIEYWPFILVGLAGAITGIVMYGRTDAGRRTKDWILIKMPVLGPMSRKAALARSLRTMSTMVTTGVSMLEGLEITARVAGNIFYNEIWTGLAARVREGSTLAQPLFEVPLIPRPIAQMIDAGERTGKLGHVMDRVATFCEDDLKIAIKAVTSMIEPIMIIVMGIIVGGVAMALLLPIFKMSKMMSQ